MGDDNEALDARVNCVRVRWPKGRAILYGLGGTGWLWIGVTLLLATLAAKLLYTLMNGWDSRQRLSHLSSFKELSREEHAALFLHGHGVQNTGLTWDGFLKDPRKDAPFKSYRDFPFDVRLGSAEKQTLNFAEVQKARPEVRTDQRESNAFCVLWYPKPTRNAEPAPKDAPNPPVQPAAPENAPNPPVQPAAPENAPNPPVQPAEKAQAAGEDGGETEAPQNVVAILEIKYEKKKDGGLQLLARILVSRELADGGEEFLFLTDEPTISVLERGQVRLGYAPIAVRVSETQLASRFFDDILKIDERLGLKKFPRLGPKDDVRRKFESYVEHALIHQLGGPSADKEGQSQDLAQPLRLPFREPMEQWSKWPRRLNGGDNYGWIQFVTVASFIVVIFNYLVHSLLISLQREDFDPTAASKGISESADECELVPDQLIALRGLIPFRRLRTSTNDDETCSTEQVIDQAWCSQSAPTAVAARVLRHHTMQGDYSQTLDLLNSQCIHVADVQASNLSFMRYFNWALPSIGFLGTVFGISDALSGAGDVLSNDPVARQQVIQSMSISLGRAFDTTLVALVLGLFAMWLYSRIVHDYERLRQGIRANLISTLQLNSGYHVKIPPKPSSQTQVKATQKETPPDPVPRLEDDRENPPKNPGL